MSTGVVSGSDAGGSGTRHAFLKPMPGDRRHGNDGSSQPDRPGPADGPPFVTEDELLATLFPHEFDPQVADGSPGSVAGLRLGHFLIEERIGRGGMGAVFRAVDTRLDRIVALKVLSPANSRDPAAVQRFRNEARAAAHLDHENIARVHFIGEDRGVHFIAFEFVRGTNVRDFIIQNGVLSPQDAVNYTLQIAQALRHAQAAGVVHRDIKPSNIIVTPSGRAKLVDLGLARQEHSRQLLELTTAGTTLGTFDYIAPEQARDPRQVDIRADIYSLGCTLYHMLTGEPPFPQGGMIQKVVDHHRDSPPDPVSRNPRVSPELSRVIRKMMASNPDDRYATPDHLIHDLGVVAQSLGLRQLHPNHLIWTVPQYDWRSAFWQQNRGWLLTVAMLLIIVVGVNQVPWDSLLRLGEGPHGPGNVVVEQTSPQAQPPGELRVPSASTPASGTGETAPPRPDSLIGTGFNAGLFHTEARGSGLLASSGSGTDMPLLVAELGHALAGSLLRKPAPGDSNLMHGIVGPEELADGFDALNSPLLPIPVEPAPAATGATPAVVPADVAGPLFAVITAAGGEPQKFATLEAACQEAPTESTIELRFDGPCPVPQRPVRIQKKRLVIRAQKGRRPVVEFQTSPIPGNDTTRMISVIEGSLKLYDVGVVVPVQTDVVTDRWVAFSLSRADALELRGVSVTFRNSNPRMAAVVEEVPALNVDAERTMPDSMMRRMLMLDWKDCVFRGECDVLVNETLDPTDAYLDNVAVAVGGWFLRVPGLERDTRSSDDARFSLRRLQHVTAVLGEGLLRVDTEMSRRDFTPLDFNWRDSVIVVRSGQPLISMAGQQDLAQFRRSLTTWHAESTWFDVTGPVWEIVPDFDSEQTLDFHAKELGESPLSTNLLQRPVRWDLPELAAYTAADFGLQKQTLPLLKATDGSDAGAVWNSRMPLQEPVRSSSATTSESPPDS